MSEDGDGEGVDRGCAAFMYAAESVKGPRTGNQAAPHDNRGRAIRRRFYAWARFATTI